MHTMTENDTHARSDGFNPAFRGAIGSKERIASGVAGGVLIAFTRRSPAALRLPLAAGATYLLARAVRGRDPVAAAIEVRRVRRNGTGPFVAERSVTIQRPRIEVYRLWRDLESLPRWMDHLEKVYVLDDKRSHWMAKGPMGLVVAWDAEITEEREGELLAWRSLPGSKVTTAGHVTFRDAPGDQGTEVHVRLEYEVPGGTGAVMLAHFLGESPDQDLREDLRRFKQVAEAGEAAVAGGGRS